MTEPEPDPVPPPVRIGNEEREQAAQALAEHFSHGRIDGAEYEERVSAAWGARTTEDLRGLFADLPLPHPAVLHTAPPTTALGFGSAAAYGPPAGLTGPPVQGGYDSGYGYGSAAGYGPGASGYGVVGHGAGAGGYDATGYGSGAAGYGTGADPYDASGYGLSAAAYGGAAATYGARGLPAPGSRPFPMPLAAPMLPGGTLDAPYGREAATGLPYSDKSKAAAGVLQLFFGFLGVGRFYTGHTGIAVAQLALSLCTFGVGGMIWGFVDGIVLLSTRSVDVHNRPLRP